MEHFVQRQSGDSFCDQLRYPIFQEKLIHSKRLNFNRALLLKNCFFWVSERGPPFEPQFCPEKRRNHNLGEEPGKPKPSIHPASRGVAAHTAGLFRSVRGAKGGFPPWGLPKLRIFTFPPPWGLPKLGNFHFSPPWGLPKLGNFHFSPPWGIFTFPSLGGSPSCGISNS